METPSSSTRRVTRSQAKAAVSANALPANNIPISKMRLEECESKKAEKCRQRNGRNNQQQQQERCALIDITNDSPIIGLAMGSVTPSSSMAMGKKRAMMMSTTTATPGSGEALLRGQVKNLLQKVEEEKSHLFQLPMGNNNNNNNRPFLVHLQSPMNLLAPTPANTPHLNPSQNLPPSLTPTPVQDKFTISQIIVNGKEECEAEEEMKVTRSLLLEFSEKLEGSDSSSMVTNETVITAPAGGGEDDVSSSRWSIQANAASGSTIDEEEEWVEDEEFLEEEEEEWVDDDHEEEEGEGKMVCNGGDLEELCQGMKKMGFNGAGKHVRFVYNSDGEIEGTVAAAVEEEEEGCCGGALVLKGLPPPSGKHLRFHEEEDEE
ncbi:hypothetical protein DM860_017258 [Cuscuta australis]|uniref:Uncharacterized protein n=1 Tax=Cuscuta australis TaxID=267555 RepID=A0A328E3I7_9ASTE|nr:hypothetical protein DM860_017258 [Cuscuta australis]